MSESVKNWNYLVIDIETLSPDKAISGGVVITEIAARAFNIENNEVILGDLFSSILDVPSQLSAGLILSPDTVKWHEKQGRSPEELLSQSGEDLADSVERFLKWCRLNLHKEVIVYAWGSDFDVPMIHKSYVTYTKDSNTSDSLFPWKYANYRCARTAFNELTEEQGQASKKPHVAAKDVDIEIQDLVTAWNFRRENKLTIKQ